jgi:hypothetical protein
VPLECACPETACANREYKQAYHQKEAPNDVRRVVKRFLNTRRLVRIVVLVIYRRRSCTAIYLDFVFACRLCSAYSIKSVRYGGIGQIMVYFQGRT